MRFKGRSTRRKGAVVAEYGVLLAGNLLVALAAISMFGHKIGDIWGTVTAIIPGAHTDDNAPLVAPQLVETALQNGAVGIDYNSIATEVGQERLGNNLGIDAAKLLIQPSQQFNTP